MMKINKMRHEMSNLRTRVYYLLISCFKNRLWWQGYYIILVTCINVFEVLTQCEIAAVYAVSI